MAYAFIGTAVNSTASSASSVSVTYSPTAGNSLFLCVSYINASTIALAANAVKNQSSTNLTYVESGTGIFDGGANGAALRLIYVPNVPSGITAVSVTLASAASFGMGVSIYEYSGLTTSATVDQNAATFATATLAADNITSGAKTPTGAPCICFAMTTNDTRNNTPTHGTGFTARTAQTHAELLGPVAAEDLRLATNTSQAGTFTNGGTSGDSFLTMMAQVDEAPAAAAGMGAVPGGLPGLRLATPVSRLRGWYDPEVPPPITPWEQSVPRPGGLRLGTPLSRLRGVYAGDSPPGATQLISGLAFGVGPVSGALTGKGILAGLAFGAGPTLASIQGSAALAGAAFAQGPVKGVLGGTANLSALLTGTGFASAALLGSGALKATAAGTGFVYSGVSGSGVLTGTSFGVGPALGSMTGISLVSGQGISAAFGYSVSTISFTFVATQPAGKHRRRFGVLDGDKLLIFDSRGDAQKARLRIAEGFGAELAKPAIRRIKVKAPMPHPREVLPLAEISRAARAANAHATYAKMLADQRYADLSRAYHDWLRLEGLRREEEEIATVLLHITWH